jgi:DNA-binding NarL/FixJ family response regulator
MSSILLIQSDPVAAERTRQVLAGAAGLEIAACVNSLAQAGEYLARQTPDVVLTDLRFADGLVPEVLDKLGSGRASRTLGVVLAPAARDPMLMEALRHGAAGYVIIDQLAETLVTTIRQVLDGESPMSPEVAREVRAYFDSQVWDNTDFVGETQSPMHLGDNDRQLLDWIEEGHALSEIARGTHTTTHLLGVQLRRLYLRMQFGVSADSLTLSLM